MVEAVRIVRKPHGKIPAIIVLPILLIVFVGAVLPRLYSASTTRPGQIDWRAMHGYEMSVERKYPHLRRGYERALRSDQAQLASIDRRIAGTTDPEMRRGLERQRAIVTSGIDVVQQILAHFPAKPVHATSRR